MTEERQPLIPKLLSTEYESPKDFSNRKRYTILGAMWIGVFLGALDTTIVATLMGSVSSSFDASNESSWVGTSFLLTLASFTPLYGRLSDIFGRRFAILLATFLFGVGTLGCGLARSLTAFVVFRALSGCGAGGMMSVSSIVATDMTSLKSRGVIQGIANLFYGLGAGAGGPLGGFISDTFGWRVAFLMQVPIVAISFTAVGLLVRYHIPGQGSSTREKLRRVDWFGSLTLISSTGCLLTSMSFKTNELRPFSDPTVWATFLGFVLFGASFVLIEAYYCKEPVLPLHLFRERSPGCILLANFCCSAAAFTILYFYPMFFEAVLLQKDAQAGYHLLPNAVALSAGSLGVGWIMRHTGRYWLALVISAALIIPTLASFTRLNEGMPTWFLWIGIIPAGVGVGSIITALLIALIASVSREEMAAATGASYLFRYSGQVVGVGISSAVMQAALAKQLHKRILGPNAEELIEKIRHTASVVRMLPEDQKAAAIASYRSALHVVFTFALGIAIVLVLLCIPIKEYPLPGTIENKPKAANSEENGHQD